MTQISPSKAALAAADWWTEKVTGIPSRRAVTGNEPRAEREPMELAAMLSLMALPEAPDGDAATKFRDLLAARIDKNMGGAPSWISLVCDYGPDRTLHDCAAEAGISSERFPWKTHMSITDEYVTAAEGYQAPDRLVWHAPDWERPACDSQEWDDHGPTGRVCREPRYHDGQHPYVETDDKCAECGDGLKGHTYGEKQHSFTTKGSES